MKQKTEKKKSDSIREIMRKGVFRVWVALDFELEVKSRMNPIWRNNKAPESADGGGRQKGEAITCLSLFGLINGQSPVSLFTCTL